MPINDYRGCAQTKVTGKTGILVGRPIKAVFPFNQIKGDSIDIILETPGGLTETVDDMVNFLRKKFEFIGIIIPGTAKSAGTIFTLAADLISLP